MNVSPDAGHLENLSCCKTAMGKASSAPLAKVSHVTCLSGQDGSKILEENIYVSCIA